MDRYERTLILHRMLKAARYPVTLKRVQEELQCSRATMYRDIAFLRDALGAPIESDSENGTIHYAKDEADRFELPGLWLSSEELAALLALNELLDRSDPGVLAGALAPFRPASKACFPTTPAVARCRSSASASSPAVRARSTRSCSAPFPARCSTASA